jgi:hypothetical protein
MGPQRIYGLTLWVRRLLVANLIDRPADFIAQREVLRLQIEQFHVHVGPK